MSHTPDRPKHLWLFDINRRNYRRNENGRAYGSPIWRDHWAKHEITGETARSWITSWGKKVPKKGGPGIAFNEADIDREAFVQEHRHRIADQIMRLTDHDTLQKVAALIGYTAPSAELKGAAQQRPL